MEIWDLYDINRVKTGETIERGKTLPPNSYHMVVHVCIFNSKGEMLIQHRQTHNHGWSNMWDVTCGGSATFGDTSQQAAERELYEEIGYKYDFSAIRPQFTMNFLHEKIDRGGFDDWYCIHAEVDIDTLKVPNDEVQRVKWATKDEILRMHDSGEFVQYYRNLIELLFEKQTKYGAYK